MLLHYTSKLKENEAGAQLGGGARGTRLLLHFILWLRIEPQHILHLDLAMYYLILTITNVPAPPHKITQLRPWIKGSPNIKLGEIIG